MISLILKRIIPDHVSPEDPTVRNRCGTLSGGIGIALNLLLCAGKLIAGIATGAISVTADALNNLSDAGSSAATLIGFRLAGQKPDPDHPFGHGRFEYLTGLVVSMLILLVGFELGKSSVEKILYPEDVRFSWLAAGILIASMCVKLWMFFFNRALSRAIQSAALKATSADSLSDCVATAAVLTGLILSQTTQLQVDGWLGLAVAIFILRAGILSIRDTLDPLLGQAPDPALVKGVQDTVLSHREIVAIHDLVIHDYGPGRRMLSLHAEVPADSDILEAHDVIDHIERELKDKYALEAVIHMDPIVMGDAETDRLRELVSTRAKEIHPDITIHDFRMTAGPLRTNLIFDMVVPFACPFSESQLKSRISAAMKEEGEHFFTVVEIDRPYTH